MGHSTEHLQIMLGSRIVGSPSITRVFRTEVCQGDREIVLNLGLQNACWSKGRWELRWELWAGPVQRSCWVPEGRWEHGVRNCSVRKWAYEGHIFFILTTPLSPLNPLLPSRWSSKHYILDHPYWQDRSRGMHDNKWASMPVTRRPKCNLHY